jgi:hypothetical protein
MLRQIANRVKGRTKSTDENPSLQEALALLNGLNGNTRGNIYYHAGHTFITLEEVATRDMVDFVRGKFLEQGDYYNNIRHQVYSGERDERHYLDLAYGEIEGRLGATVVKGSPFRKASIDFVVEKQE